LQGCSNVYCVVPNTTELKRIKAYVHPELPIVIYKNFMILTCDSGMFIFVIKLLNLFIVFKLYRT